jgi:hypothetical protein
VRYGEAHGKEKQLTAPTPNGMLQPLPCAGKKRTAIPTHCRAPQSKTHDKQKKKNKKYNTWRGHGRARRRPATTALEPAATAPGTRCQ